jgi:hypothetical protein
MPYKSAWALGLVAVSAAWGACAQVRTGDAALGDWRTDAPGVVRHITAADMPAPFATAPSAFPAAVTPRPKGATLKTLPGFTVAVFAKLDHPRQLRVAPNGDVFVAGTDSGRITILRAADGASAPATTSVFAETLKGPFGIAFYPAGPHPKWVYVANNNSVVRFAYRTGDLKARGAPQTVVAKLADTSGYHTTRDIDFSADGRTMLVSVGSGSNVAEEIGVKTPSDAAAWQADHAPGAAWGQELGRADVLAFSPEGEARGVFAAGIRNCVSLRFNPSTGEPWCAVNERDNLGDNLPPDYVTRVHAGGFYGWPWYYIGAHQDPRLKNQRLDLAAKVSVPDVLLQPHSAPLGLAFYTAKRGVAAFPAAYLGDAFVGLHGSWNRAKRTGYKIVRLKVRGGVPTGDYEDFVTGFVVDDRSVWGRPVGVAVAHDGALLFADDSGDTVWRVAYGARAANAK